MSVIQNYQMPYAQNYQMPYTQKYQMPCLIECENGTIYVVKTGDLLFSIAKKYGITVKDMIEANPQIADPNVVENY